MTVNLSNVYTGPGPVEPSKKRANTHLEADPGHEEFSKHLHHKHHKHHKHQHQHHLFPQNQAHDDHGDYF